jgi:hypothetical protein
MVADFRKSGGRYPGSIRRIWSVNFIHDNPLPATNTNRIKLTLLTSVVSGAEPSPIRTDQPFSEPHQILLASGAEWN